nr:putative reverse transcriptase domain, viral movement protein [Tanacetum cinerariifolium]
MSSFPRMLQFKRKMLHHAQLLRWSNWFSQWKFTVKHIKGTENVLADFLSCPKAYKLEENYPKDASRVQNHSPCFLSMVFSVTSHKEEGSSSNTTPTIHVFDLPEEIVETIGDLTFEKRAKLCYKTFLTILLKKHGLCIKGLRPGSFLPPKSVNDDGSVVYHAPYCFIHDWYKVNPSSRRWIEANRQWLYDNFDHCEVETSDGDDDASDEDEEADKVHTTINAETKDASAPKSSSPRSSKIQELTNQVLILQYQKHKLELDKNKAKAKATLLRAQPSFPNMGQLNELLMKLELLNASFDCIDFFKRRVIVFLRCFECATFISTNMSFIIMNEKTRNTSYDHLFVGKKASSIARQVKEDEASRTIKLEYLAKLVLSFKPSFKDLDSPRDDPIIVVDDSDEDEEADEVHTTINAETKDASAPKSTSPRSSKIQELTNQVLIL